MSDCDPKPWLLRQAMVFLSVHVMESWRSGVKGVTRAGGVEVGYTSHYHAWYPTSWNFRILFVSLKLFRASNKCKHKYISTHAINLINIQFNIPIS
jgi:hypothetical protein